VEDHAVRTYVYVDAFNLYYGALKGTPYKWLDLQALCRVMIPKNAVNCIKYFTARIHPRVGDPDQPMRQIVYLRALQTMPNLQIHKTVGVINPQKTPCKALQSAARFYKHIREAALQASQFPPVLTDKQGTFHKPPAW
jgi:hypothetical protein